MEFTCTPIYGLIGPGSSTDKPWWEKENKQPNGKKIKVEAIQPIESFLFDF